MFTNDSLILKKFYSKKNNEKFNNLNEIYEYFLKCLKNNLVKSKIINSFDTINVNDTNLNTNPYVTDDIKNEIKLLNQKTSGEINYGKTNIKINIFHKNTDKIGFLIYELINIIHFLFSIYKNNKNIELNLYLSDKKKQLPENITNSFIFGRDQANSGCCRRSNFINDTSVVDIWRKEEILKVTVHELIHALDIDIEINDTNDIINHYQSKYNISSNKINTNEAYTEILANIINCFWISQKQGKNKLNFFQKLLNLEKNHCLFQCSKIYEISDLNQKTIDLNYETNILAYYLIRGEIYKNFDNFLSFLKNKNKDFLTINVNEWYELLRNNTKIEKSDIIYKKENNDFTFKNTRMTCLELKVIN